ncbi:MAG: DUF4446 family protein [Tissierellia bacterium]|nr:DUF4446 family protein [Tissierellia bacterium]
MENIFEIIGLYNAEIIIGMALLIVILLVSYIILNVKVSKLRKRYKKLVRGKNDVDIEEVLLKYGEEIDQLKNQGAEFNKSLIDLNDRLSSAIQKVGFIRYNAFEDMGYDLSFSIALLDDQLNGFVITSIYNKDQSICYAKPIKNGKSIYPLTVEEMQSIDRAIKGNMLIENY